MDNLNIISIEYKKDSDAAFTETKTVEGTLVNTFEIKYINIMLVELKRQLKECEENMHYWCKLLVEAQKLNMIKPEDSQEAADYITYYETRHPG